MILSHAKKNLWAYRTLRDCPAPIDSGADITLFANYYGTVKETKRFNDPALYTDKSWWTRIKSEIRELYKFRKNGKKK